MWLGSFLGRLGHHGKDSAATTGGLKSAAWAEQGPKKGNPQTEPFSKKTPSYQKSPTSYFVQSVFVLYMCHVFFVMFVFCRCKKQTFVRFVFCIRDPPAQVSGVCERVPRSLSISFRQGESLPRSEMLYFCLLFRNPPNSLRPSKTF